MLELISTALLAAGTLLVLLSCAALAAADDPFSKLHFLAPSTTVGALLLGGSIVAVHGADPAGFKAVAVVLLLVFSGSATSHTLARAWRIRRAGSWKQHGEAESNSDTSRGGAV